MEKKKIMNTEMSPGLNQGSFEVQLHLTEANTSCNEIAE